MNMNMTMSESAGRPRRWRRVATVSAALLLAWLLAAYLVLPALWKRYASRHPSFDDVPNITHTADDTPGDTLAPQALLRAGDAYATLWRRPELDPTYGRSAMATYQEVVNRFPSSTAARQAQSHILQLQDQFAYKNYKAGLYYVRMKAWDSAILYFRDVVATYPRSAIAPSALVEL